MMNVGMYERKMQQRRIGQSKELQKRYGTSRNYNDENILISYPYFSNLVIFLNGQNSSCLDSLFKYTVLF